MRPIIISSKEKFKSRSVGIPRWRSGLAPAFGLGRDPGDPGSNPTSGSRCMEPASPSACVSASLSLSLSVTIIKLKKKVVSVLEMESTRRKYVPTTQVESAI